MQMNAPNKQKEILIGGNAAEARISPPGKKRLIWIGVLAAVLAAGAVWLLLVAVPPQPRDLVYGGQRLSWWLTNSSIPQNILQQIDSNAAPYLTQVLARRNAWWRKIYTNLPATLKNRIPPPFSTPYTASRAAWLLSRTGPGSPQTVRALIHAAQKDEDIQARVSAIDALGDVAPGNEEAVAAVLNVAQTDPADFAKIAAVRSLARIGGGNRLAIQTLSQMATNGPDTQILRHEALTALEKLQVADPNSNVTASNLTHHSD